MPEEPHEIDPGEVQKHAHYGLKTAQIATLVGCSTASLRDRFSKELKLGRAEFKRDLRMFQYQAARKGSPPLLIHLGKCELKQTNQRIQMEYPEPDVDPTMD